VNGVLVYTILCSIWYGISPMHSEISGPIAIFAILACIEIYVGVLYSVTRYVPGAVDRCRMQKGLERDKYW